jgi:zinc transport system substrate-binding protein
MIASGTGGSAGARPSIHAQLTIIFIQVQHWAMSHRSLGFALVALLLAATGAAGCSGRDGAGAEGRLAVVAAFYPLQFVAERVGGDRVAVSALTPPGAEPHDLELTPKQRTGLHDADLVVYLAGFQPSVDEAVADTESGRAFDVAAVEPLRDAPPGAEEDAGGEEHANEGKDPHVWLDPVRLAAIADGLAGRLADADAAHRDEYRSRAAALRTDLEALDREFAAGLENCQRREIVTSHAAFGYLANRYRLEQIPITGLDPESEPTPQHVAEIAALARQRGVTTIFFETLVSPKVAETVATEIGAKAEVLDPIEGLQSGSGDTYLTVMRANLARLRAALGCG